MTHTAPKPSAARPAATLPNAAPARARTRPLGVVARLLAAVALGTATLAGGTGCANDARVLAQAEQAHGELSKAVVTDPEMAGYIQEVGDRLVSTAARLNADGRLKAAKKSSEQNDWMFSDAMRFHFVNSTTLNAFTTGGEHMYLYTELLRRSRNEGRWPPSWPTSTPTCTAGTSTAG
jgi:predicted Zn-dependent protease